MDTLTHGLAGAVIGRAIAGKENVPAIVAVSAAGAMFPDLDAFFLPGSFFSLGDTLNYLRYHRGVTHSFLLAPVFALLIAFAVRWIARRTPWRRLFGAALLGIVSHILFDWITSYGTMFFAPLSWRRFALDWVFILDPYFTGIPLIALVLSLVFRRHGARIAIGGTALLLLYVGFCGIVHARATGVAARMFPGANVSALPQPFSPRRWALFASRIDSIDVAYVGLGAPPIALAPEPPPGEGFLRVLARLRRSYPAPQAARIESFPREENDPAVRAAAASPEVRVWSAFARFPVAKVERLPGGENRITLTDLRFRGPWGNPAFEYEVVLDREGRPRASGFVRLFVTGGSKRRK
jgi:inner membrane protein